VGDTITWEHNDPFFYYVALDGRSHWTSYLRGPPFLDKLTKGIDTGNDIVQEVVHNGPGESQTTIDDRLTASTVYATLWLQALDAGHTDVPGITWVCVLLASSIVICLTGCTSRGEGCAQKLCGATLGALLTLALFVAVVSYSVPAHVYFTNPVDSALLIANDEKLEAAEPLSHLGALVTFVAVGAVAVLAVSRLAECAKGRKAGGEKLKGDIHGVLV